MVGSACRIAASRAPKYLATPVTSTTRGVSLGGASDPAVRAVLDFLAGDVGMKGTLPSPGPSSPEPIDATHRTGQRSEVMRT
jgi:hypothetical protein